MDDPFERRELMHRYLPFGSGRLKWKCIALESLLHPCMAFQELGNSAVRAAICCDPRLTWDAQIPIQNDSASPQGPARSFRARLRAKPVARVGRAHASLETARLHHAA